MPHSKDGFLSKLFEDSPFGILVADGTARIVEANPAACAIYGYSREEFTALRVRDIMAPDFSPLAEKHFADMDPEPGFMAVRNRRKNGELFPVEVGVRRTTHNGRTVLMAMIRDTSAAKRAETELARARDLYQKMLDTSLDAVLLLDLDLRVRAANRRTAEYLRFPDAGPLTGRAATDFVEPGDRPRIEAIKKKALERGSVRGESLTCLRSDGEAFKIELGVSLFRNEEGEPDGFVVSGRDLTDRLKAESALKESESWMTGLLDHSPIYIFLSKQGRLEYVNKTALAAAGVNDPSSMLGRSVLDFVAPEYKRTMAERVRTLMETGNPVPPIEIDLTAPDGRRFPVSIYSAPFRYRDENIIVTFALNISDFKEANRAARASQELYRTLTQAMPDFIYALDTDGRITYCNRWLEQFREDPTGKTQREVFPEETADAGFNREVQHPA